VLMSYFFTGTLSLLRFSPYPPLAIFWVKHFPIAEILFWSSAAGGYFIRMHSQLRAQERRSAQLALEKSQLEAGLKQAQLEVIRARLNPHFLYNSLQNISAMAKQDPQTASRMLARLGDILRTVLRQDSRPESTLAEEMELAQAYVALEQMRFGDRLKATFNVPPELRPAMVPCFILQPLIENAVIHGLRGIRKTGIIDIAAAKEGDRLVLTVTDNGAGLPEQEPPALKTGFGLGSTAERLSNMYPGAHEFRIERLPAGGTQVRIAIPLRLAGFEDGRLNDE